MNSVFSSKRYLYQLTIFISLAVFFFLSCYLADYHLPSNELVKRTADNIYGLRTSLLDLLFRIAPFLVPVVIATASIMLNKYTEAFLIVIFQNNKIRLFVTLSGCFFVFHLLVALAAPIDTWRDSGKLILYYERFFIILLIDTLLAAAVAFFTLVVCFEVFLYTQPSKLIQTFTKEIDYYSKKIKEEVLLGSISDTKEIQPTIKHLEKNINQFINLSVIAVKSKDNETIKNSITTVGNTIWHTIVSSLEHKNETVEEMRNRIRSDIEDHIFEIHNMSTHVFDWADLVIDTRINTMVEVSVNYLPRLEEQIAVVYKEIYESAFSSKEFTACKHIIDSLKLVAENKLVLRPEKIFNIYVELFEITLSYNYHGYTKEYCLFIVEKISEIYGSQYQSIDNLDVYFQLMKKSFDHKNPSILKIILKYFRDSYKFYFDADIETKIIHNLKNAGMYALFKKSMLCFAEYIRFLTTSELPIKKFNKVFSDIIIIANLVEEMSFDFSDIDLSELEDNDEFDLGFYDTKSKTIFEIPGDYTYFEIKFYVIFYSYYSLQVRISPDRILLEEKNEDVHNNINGVVPFYLIRTILLDLETQLDNWNKLFVSQAEYHFTDTSRRMLKMSEYVLVENEIITYGETKLLGKLKQTIDSLVVAAR